MGIGFENKKEGNKMKCMRCGNNAYQSRTTEAIELGNGVLVIRNIPCYKCEHCDEVMFTGDIIQQIERIIAEAKQRMEQVSIIEFEKSA